MSAPKTAAPLARIERAVSPSAIVGLSVITLQQVTDDRGTVCEFYRHSLNEDFAGASAWRQINATTTAHGAVRGLHGEQMSKLVGVVAGEAFGAWVDARPDSPSVGAVLTTPLVPGTQVFVPAGVLNGFQAVSDEPTLYLYCFDEEWRPGMTGVAANPLDPALGIAWPIPIDPTNRAQISAKDAGLPTLREVLAG